MSPVGTNLFHFTVTMIAITVYLAFVIKHRERLKAGSLPLWLYYIVGGLYALFRIEIFLDYPTIGGLIVNTGVPKRVFGVLMSSFTMGPLVCCLISLLVLQKRADRAAAANKLE